MDDPPIHGIEVTPLLDVVLGVVAALMASSLTLAPPDATGPIEVVLPNSCMPSDVVTLTVSIADDETLYLDGERLDWDELGQRARAFAPRHPARRVVFVVDARASQAAFIRALAVVRQADFAHYALLTSPE